MFTLKTSFFQVCLRRYNLNRKLVVGRPEDSTED